MGTYGRDGAHARQVVSIHFEICHVLLARCFCRGPPCNAARESLQAHGVECIVADLLSREQEAAQAPAPAAPAVVAPPPPKKQPAEDLSDLY